MAAHGHTITWGSHAGRHTGGVQWHWLQRLEQWFAGRGAKNGRTNTMAVHGTWDGRREQFRPFTAESALDHAAAQGGQKWSMTLYNAAL